MKLEPSVILKMKRLGIVGREENEGVIEGVGMPSKRERELRKIVDVYLWLVGACAHNPIPIFTDAYAIAGFFKFEILEQFDPVLVLNVGLETALPASCEPVGQRSRRGSAGYCVDRNGPRIGKLHGQMPEVRTVLRTRAKIEMRLFSEGR